MERYLTWIWALQSDQKPLVTLWDTTVGLISRSEILSVAGTSRGEEYEELARPGLDLLEQPPFRRDAQWAFALSERSGRLEKPVGFAVAAWFTAMFTTAEAMMVGPSGFYNLSQRYEALSAAGDPLERLAAVVDFEVFRGLLVAALLRSARGKGG